MVALELDFVLQELNRLKEKEKSIRRKIHLENAVSELKEFQKLSKDF